MGRYYDDELYHHGIKGQRWGIRRFQNKDGSYTSAGKSHRKVSNFTENQNGIKRGLSDKQKRALKIGAAAVGVALVAYGSYKVGSHVKIQSDAKKIVSKAFDEYKKQELDKMLAAREGAKEWKQNLDLKLDESFDYTRDKIERDFDPIHKEKIRNDIKKLTQDTKDYLRKERKQKFRRATDRYARAFPATPYVDPRQRYDRYRGGFDAWPEYASYWRGYGYGKKK